MKIGLRSLNLAVAWPEAVIETSQRGIMNGLTMVLPNPLNLSSGELRARS